MPFCVLLRCSNTSKSKKEDSGVTFHRFPKPDHSSREAWIHFVQICRNDNLWLPNDYSYICSAHFKAEDKYLTKAKRVFLKKGAVPQLPNIELVPASKISESVSDSESILDPPKIIVLKRKLLKETAARKQLAIKYRKVMRQNRYLMKKCHSYKSLVDLLKNKFGIDSSPVEICSAVYQTP